MGKCKENVLFEMYDFVSKLLIEKYNLISHGNIEKELNGECGIIEIDTNKSKSKTKKNKKKIILINEINNDDINRKINISSL